MSIPPMGGPPPQATVPTAPVAPPAPPPKVMQDGATIDYRVSQLENPLNEHFRMIQTLDSYSRRLPQNWFGTKASVNAESVVLSTIRAVEKTVIAYLAGGKPQWKVSSYAGFADQGQQDRDRSDRDALFERLARAIFHHIDRQAETSLLYDPVERAVRQGEVIMEYGWLDEASRVIQDPMSPDLSSVQEINLDDPVGAGMLTGYMAGDAALAEGDQGHPGTRYRFPVFVRVHDRVRVFYELDPFGEPIEVYHKYTARASQLAEEYPEWAAKNSYNPQDLVKVVRAFVGSWWCLSVEGTIVSEPRQHLYGARPPFVIERCAPENVASGTSAQNMSYNAAEVRAGMPFCADMMTAFERACKYASLKKVIIEQAAFGSLILKNANPERFRRGPDGTMNAVDIVMGPGVVIPLMKDEELAPPPLMAIPAAMAEYLDEPAQELAALSFSMKLMTGEAQGDPSGYGVEQTRQAAMARLQPWKDSLGRAFSRLFEKIFGCLALNWAAEWGDSVTLTGEHNGKFFAETITPDQLTPAPDHIEMILHPAIPQNKIAEDQAMIARVQAGLLDPLTAMEEMGVADPQAEWDSALVHKEQVENPMARQMAVQAILADRMRKKGIQPPPVMSPAPGMPGPGMPGQPSPGMPPMPGQSQAPAGMPGGANLGAQPPMMPGMAPNQAMPMQRPALPPAAGGGSRGPAPQQRPGLAPLGVPGAPNPPVPNVRTTKTKPGGK